MITKTRCGAECWTDHRLVVSRLNLRIQPAWRPQGKRLDVSDLDVSKLNQDNMRQAFETDICNQLINLGSKDPEENWKVFHNTVHSSVATTVRHPSRNHQDCFDEKLRDFLKKMTDYTRYIKMILAQYPRHQLKTVQTKHSDMQDSWLRNKTEEIQSFVDREDMDEFHNHALRTIYGPKSSGVTTLLSIDGSTLQTDQEAIFERGTEHFNSVLNHQASVRMLSGDFRR